VATATDFGDHCARVTRLSALAQVYGRGRLGTHGVGRGAGVGRGRGVGIALAVGNWNVPTRVNQEALAFWGNIRWYARRSGRLKDRLSSCCSPPPCGVGLGATASSHYGFTLAEVIWRVAGQTPGVTDRGEYAVAGCGIPDGHIALFIYGQVRHPAPQPVAGVVPALLLHRGCRETASSHVELIPANSNGPIWAVQEIGAICPQRFGAVEILVNNRCEESVAHCVQFCVVPSCGTKRVLKLLSKESMNPSTVMSVFGLWSGPMPNVEFPGFMKST
jgi:hypothetical protein